MMMENNKTNNNNNTATAGPGPSNNNSCKNIGVEIVCKNVVTARLMERLTLRHFLDSFPVAGRSSQLHKRTFIVKWHPWTLNDTKTRRLLKLRFRSFIPLLDEWEAIEQHNKTFYICIYIHLIYTLVVMQTLSLSRLVFVAHSRTTCTKIHTIHMTLSQVPFPSTRIFYFIYFNACALVLQQRHTESLSIVYSRYSSLYSFPFYQQHTLNIINHCRNT